MRGRSTPSCVLALAWLAFACEPAAARELWRSGDAYLDASGEVREIAVWTRGTSQEEFEAGVEPACFSSPMNFASPVKPMPGLAPGRFLILIWIASRR